MTFDKLAKAKELESQILYYRESLAVYQKLEESKIIKIANVTDDGEVVQAYFTNADKQFIIDCLKKRDSDKLYKLVDEFTNL